jgi:hypothetical protein
MSCYFLNSSGDLVLHFVLYLFIKLALLLILKCMKQAVFLVNVSKNEKVTNPSVNYKIAKGAIYAYNVMGYGFLFNTLMAFQLDFLLSAFANIRFLKTDGLFGSLNLTVSVVLILIYLAAIFTSFIKQVKIERFES